MVLQGVVISKNAAEQQEVSIGTYVLSRGRLYSDSFLQRHIVHVLTPHYGSKIALRIAETTLASLPEDDGFVHGEDIIDYFARLNGRAPLPLQRPPSILSEIRSRVEQWNDYCPSPSEFIPLHELVDPHLAFAAQERRCSQKQIWQTVRDLVHDRGDDLDHLVYKWGGGYAVKRDRAGVLVEQLKDQLCLLPLDDVLTEAAEQMTGHPPGDLENHQQRTALAYHLEKNFHQYSFPVHVFGKDDFTRLFTPCTDRRAQLVANIITTNHSARQRMQYHSFALTYEELFEIARINLHLNKADLRQKVRSCAVEMLERFPRVLIRRSGGYSVGDHAGTDLKRAICDYFDIGYRSLADGTLEVILPLELKLRAQKEARKENRKTAADIDWSNYNYFTFEWAREGWKQVQVLLQQADRDAVRLTQRDEFQIGAEKAQAATDRNQLLFSSEYVLNYLADRLQILLENREGVYEFLSWKGTRKPKQAVLLSRLEQALETIRSVTKENQRRYKKMRTANGTGSRLLQKMEAGRTCAVHALNDLLIRADVIDTLVTDLGAVLQQRYSLQQEHSLPPPSDGVLGESYEGFSERVQAIQRQHQAYIIARNKLAVPNIRLVADEARKFSGRGISFIDLIGGGVFGLLDAAAAFEHRLGRRFSTYATTSIRRRIQRQVNGETTLVRTPDQVSNLIYKYRVAERMLAHELGRKPGDEDLAQALHLSSSQIREIASVARRPLSLDRPRSDEDSRSARIHEIRAPLSDSAFDQERSELREEIHALMKMAKLKPRERDIVLAHHRIGQDDKLTLKDIGDGQEVTPERIRQIEEQAMRKLARVASGRPFPLPLLVRH